MKSYAQKKKQKSNTQLYVCDYDYYDDCKRLKHKSPTTLTLTVCGVLEYSWYFWS